MCPCVWLFCDDAPLWKCKAGLKLGGHSPGTGRSLEICFDHLLQTHGAHTAQITSHPQISFVMIKDTLIITNEKTGKCTLILYKTNELRAVLNAYMHPIYCLPEMHPVTSILWAEPMLWFVSLLIHRAIHTTLWTSQTSADHEQGAWSVTGARSLVKWCMHYIVPLLGNAQYGIAYFIIYKIILIFQNLILQTDPLNKKKKILRQ